MSTTAAGSWQTGTLLDDRYRLAAPVGSGGSATVWQARDERLGRMVAVKLLNPRFVADEWAVQRLSTEAQALARLRHRHIAEVYDFGLDRQDHQVPVAFLVMELIDGSSVGQALHGGRSLPWPQAVAVAAQTAGALAAAHARGVVHRDIAPGNILLTGDGVRIIDFGICASTGSDEVGPDGNLIGTPAYLAPERVDGQPVQPAADVYALGVLLYRMLSGELPWRADTPVGLLTAPRFRPPDPLPDIEGLPPAVAAAVAACLDRDPAARPTAAQLAQTLGEVDTAGAATAAGAALPADAATLTHILPWQPLPEPVAPRRRGRTVALAAAVAGLAAAAVAVWVLNGAGPSEPSTAAPAASAPPACDATFQLRGDTGRRFAATVTVVNAAGDTRTPARISFDLPGTQRVDADARWRQDGRTVTATGTRDLAPEARLSLPVAWTYQESNPLPTAFRLDGRPCAASLLGPAGAPISGQPSPTAQAPASTEPTGPVPPPQQSPGSGPQPASPSPEPSPTEAASPPAPSPSTAEDEEEDVTGQPVAGSGPLGRPW
ncbi:serine/threonine-protein kinase [Catellatospora bangladeshensis]|uniref:non-specific serine/threonine protein kinase n=1 Tax=Catellatospora bangladeshensis TaxID=310355 RepID=A0A8J3JE55_9ACTN|nr:serine/threonine-protein kinase [Catellatospora bangladeshensis]GIF82761.1 hypothetical protein Cba03nite_41100 [Catellatospora bangladeshensis]